MMNVCLFCDGDIIMLAHLMYKFELMDGFSFYSVGLFGGGLNV